MSKRRIGFLHPASFYHLADLADPAVRAWNIVDCYAPELQAADLERLDSLYVASRQHPVTMHALAPLVLDFVNTPGKKVFIGGENQVGSWLPGVREEYRETNFWAWRTGEDLGRRNKNPGNPLWQYLNDEALHWHFHGALFGPAGAVSLVDLDEGLPVNGSILYHDDASYAGEVVVTTMDPDYHHGAGFMPGATQLLYRMLQWLGS
ncbi:MAG: hypothetical protein Q4G30_00360 [Actinomycetaceae bacterium]|nr:hypothetical protein [Actinomycetaceae bacterium]